MDKWVLSKLTGLVVSVNESLERYDASSASLAMESFLINDFSTWYIRRSRDRVGPLSLPSERNATLSIMYGILVTFSKLLAPFAPFASEEIFINLTGEESVHLTDYPLGDKSLLDEKLEKEMEEVKKLVEMGRAKRKDLGIKVRQPLAQFTINNLQLTIQDEGLVSLIKDELNVKRVSFSKGKGEVAIDFDIGITQELADEGAARDIIRAIQEKRKELGTDLGEKISVELPDWPKEFEGYIKTKALVKSIKKGSKFMILRG